MKRKKLYMAILLFAGILTSCKVGKSYVRPDLHLPDSLAQHQDSVSFGDQDWKDIYADSTLCSLIDRALEHNKDMLIAAGPCEGNGCTKTNLYCSFASGYKRKSNS